jgi:hypothetical protein
MKRTVAIVLGAAVIALGTPSVAAADTGSSATGSAESIHRNALSLITTINYLIAGCTPVILSGQVCAGVAPTPAPFGE